MNDLDGRAATTIEITPDDIWRVAGTANQVCETLTETNDTVAIAIEGAVATVPGWDCAATLNGVGLCWERKVAALTIGDNGFDEYAESLRRFVSDVTTTDQANATGLETDAGVNAEFGGEYEPVAAKETHRLLNGEPDHAGGG